MTNREMLVTDREMLEYVMQVLESADGIEALTDLLETIRTHLKEN